MSVSLGADQERRNGDIRLRGSDGTKEADGWDCVMYELVMNGYTENGVVRP